MLNVLKAIISGKRGQEVYDLLSDEEKVKLNEYAKLYGVNRPSAQGNREKCEETCT